MPRPKGFTNKIRPAETIKPDAKRFLRKLMRARAADDGELPHEFLLRIARGEAITMTNGVIFEPNIDMRIHCAIACAPYWAPKLAQIEAKVEQETTYRISQDPLTPTEWDELYGAKEEEDFN